MFQNLLFYSKLTIHFCFEISYYKSLGYFITSPFHDENRSHFLILQSLIFNIHLKKNGFKK